MKPATRTASICAIACTFTFAFVVAAPPAFPQSAALPDEQYFTHRFALIIGTNNGGPGREKLRYAVSDARAMLQVLESLGGVAVDDSRLLVEPDRETFLWEIARLRERIMRRKSAKTRQEAIIYYSGHSDDDGILLGRERISYREFRSQLENLGADVRIAILDSCASGAVLRAKGGKRRAPFLFDSAYDMKGTAVMTSSSADEVSQESERIHGSFFTHHLISGLRGAADTSQDGRVTLNEAYQYAFGETLNQTEKTSGGPQHPSYDIRMSGTGDVVLTDVRRSGSVLRLKREVAGKVFIHNQANALVMEFRKRPDAEAELGLGRGRYRVIVINDGEIREATVELATGETRELDEGQFSPADIVDTIARGDQKADRAGGKREKRPFSFLLGFYGKASRYEGHWSFMPGMQFGVVLNRSFYLGLTGYGKTATKITSRPPFWGLHIGYQVLEQRALELRIQAVAGFMYKDNEDWLVRRMSLVVEPGIALSLAVRRNLKILTQFSLDFVHGTNDNLRRFSCGMGLEFAKP